MWGREVTDVPTGPSYTVLSHEHLASCPPALHFQLSLLIGTEYNINNSEQPTSTSNATLHVRGFATGNILFRSYLVHLFTGWESVLQRHITVYPPEPFNTVCLCCGYTADSRPDTLRTLGKHDIFTAV